MIEMLAEYGDGVWHRYGHWLARTSLPFALCRANGGAMPEKVKLEHQAPEGAALCPWCMEDRISPRSVWWHPAPRRRTYKLRPGQVYNRELRAAFERSGLSAADVARRLGWMSGAHADSTRVRRVLGLAPGYHRGRPRIYRAMSKENAAAIAEALGLDPVDVGL